LTVNEWRTSNNCILSNKAKRPLSVILQQSPWSLASVISLGLSKQNSLAKIQIPYQDKFYKKNLKKFCLQRDFEIGLKFLDDA